jgi:transcriptional regulator with XRE-family HTH domain
MSLLVTGDHTTRTFMAAAGYLSNQYGALRRRLVSFKGLQGGPLTMKQRELTASGVVVGLLRLLRGWNQTELGNASGIDKSLISRYERGTKVPSRRTLERLSAAAGVPFSWVEQKLPKIGAALAAIKDGAPAVAQSSPGAADMGEAVLAQLGFQLEGQVPPTREQARREAEELWDYFKDRSARDRHVLVEGAREYKTWAFCERLCFASEAAAPNDAGQAVGLAELAVRVAELSRGEEAFRMCLQGYAWAFLGNARRVQGNHPSADEAFSRFERLWKTGDLADPQPLAGWLPFDLEASLRRHQDRSLEALELHDRALALAKPSDHGILLLNKAKTLEEMARFDEAVEALTRAAPLVKAGGEPRLLFALHCNTAVNLCHLNRYAEADILLPEVQRLVGGLGTRLDAVRVRWLQGKVAAGLGKREEGITTLTEVQQEFKERGIAFDTALVSLDLAVVHLEEGHTSEVKALAQQMMSIFKAQGVHREVLAALQLFYDAAKREMATVDLARQLVRFLHRARHDPELKFEPEGQPL